MNKKARRNYIRATSQLINRKKMYKAKKQWIVAGMSFLVAMGIGASAQGLSAHADVTNTHIQTTTMAKGPQSSTSVIQNQASQLHKKILDNAPIHNNIQSSSVSAQSNGLNKSASNKPESVATSVQPKAVSNSVSSVSSSAQPQAKPASSALTSSNVAKPSASKSTSPVSQSSVASASTSVASSNASKGITAPKSVSTIVQSQSSSAPVSASTVSQKPLEKVAKHNLGDSYDPMKIFKQMATPNSNYTFGWKLNQDRVFHGKWISNAKSTVTSKQTESDVQKNENAAANISFDWNTGVMKVYGGGYITNHIDDAQISLSDELFRQIFNTNYINPSDVVRKLIFVNAKAPQDMSHFWERHFNFFNTNDKTNLKTLTYIDFSGLDTSHTTNMSYMLASDSDIGSDTLATMANLDTHNVTDMSNMFKGGTSFSQPFYNSLTRIPRLNWDVSNVKDMSNMFGMNFQLTDASGIEGFSNPDNVTNLTDMFGNTNVEKAPTLSWDIGKNDTNNNVSMLGMFWNDGNLSDISGLSNLNTSHVSNMNSLFGSSYIPNWDSAMKNWNVENVTDISNILGVGSKTMYTPNGKKHNASDVNDDPHYQRGNTVYYETNISNEINPATSKTFHNWKFKTVPKGAETSDYTKRPMFADYSGYTKYIGNHFQPDLISTPDLISKSDFDNNPVLVFKHSSDNMYHYAPYQGQYKWGTANVNINSNNDTIYVHDGTLSRNGIQELVTSTIGSTKIIPLAFHNNSDSDLDMYSDNISDREITSGLPNNKTDWTIKFNNVKAPKDSSNLLSIDNVASNIRTIDLAGLDTSNTTNMFGMFFQNPHLQYIENASDMNTANVTDISYLLTNDTALKNWSNIYNNWYFKQKPKARFALGNMKITSDWLTDSDYFNISNIKTSPITNSNFAKNDSIFAKVIPSDSLQTSIGSGQYIQLSDFAYVFALPLHIIPSDGITPRTYKQLSGKHTGTYMFPPVKVTDTFNFYAYGKFIKSDKVNGIESDSYTLPKSSVPNGYALVPNTNTKFTLDNQIHNIDIAKFGYDMVEFTYNNKPIYIIASPYNYEAMSDGGEGSIMLSDYKYPYYDTFDTSNNLYGYVKDYNMAPSNILGKDYGDSWNGSEAVNHNYYSLTNSDINFIKNMKPSDYHYEDKIVKIPVRANFKSNTINFTLNGKIIASKSWTGFNTGSDLGMTTYMKQLASDAPKYTTTRDGLDDSKYIVTNQGISAINDAISDANREYFSSNFQYNNSVLNIPVEPIPKLGVDTINYVDTKTGHIIGRHTFTPANSKDFSDNDIVKFASDSDTNTFRGYMYYSSDNNSSSYMLPSDNSLRTAKEVVVLDADIDKDLNNPSDDTYELAPQGIKTLRDLRNESGQFHYKNAVVNVDVQSIPRASAIFHYIYNGKIVGQYSINGIKNTSSNDDGSSLINNGSMIDISGVYSIPNDSTLKGLSPEYGLSENEFNQLNGDDGNTSIYNYDNTIHNINVVPINSTDTLKYYVGNKSNVIDTDYATSRTNMNFIVGYNDKQDGFVQYEVSMPSKLKKDYRLANKKQLYAYDGGTKYIQLLPNYNTDIIHYIVLDGDKAGMDATTPAQKTGKYNKSFTIKKGTKVNGYTVIMPAKYKYDGKSHDVFVTAKNSKTINLNLIYKVRNKVVRQITKPVSVSFYANNNVTGNYSDRDNNGTEYVSDLDPTTYDKNNYNDDNIPVSFTGDNVKDSYTYTYNALPASNLEIVYYDVHEIDNVDANSYQNHPIINTVTVTAHHITEKLTGEKGKYTPAIEGQQINLNTLITDYLPEGYHISDESTKPKMFTLIHTKGNHPVKLMMGTVNPEGVAKERALQSEASAQQASASASTSASLSTRASNSVLQSYINSADTSIATSYKDSVANSVKTLDNSIASHEKASVANSVANANHALASNDAKSADNSIANSYRNSINASVASLNNSLAESAQKSANKSIASSYNNSISNSVANANRTIASQDATKADNSIINNEKQSVTDSVAKSNQAMASSVAKSTDGSISNSYKVSIAQSVANVNSSIANSYAQNADNSIEASYKNSVADSVSTANQSLASYDASVANASIANSEKNSVTNSVNSSLTSSKAKSVSNSSAFSSKANKPSSEANTESSVISSSNSVVFNNMNIDDYIPSDNEESNTDKLVAELEAKPVVIGDDTITNNHGGFKQFINKPMKHVAHLHDIKVGHTAKYYGMKIKHLRISKGMKLNRHAHIYISIKLRRLASRVSLRHRKFHINGAYEIIGKHGKYVRLQIKIGHHIYYVSGKALRHANHR